MAAIKDLNPLSERIHQRCNVTWSNCWMAIERVRLRSHRTWQKYIQSQWKNASWRFVALYCGRQWNNATKMWASFSSTHRFRWEHPASELECQVSGWPHLSRNKSSSCHVWCERSLRLLWSMFHGVTAEMIEKWKYLGANKLESPRWLCPRSANVPFCR